MISDEKLVEVAKGLLEKTRKQQAVWNSLKTDFSRFSLHLPTSHVEIRYDSSRTAPDVLHLYIITSDGKTVGDWTVEEESEHWPLAWSLYQEITKQHTKWDKALAEVEEFIHR